MILNLNVRELVVFLLLSPYLTRTYIYVLHHVDNADIRTIFRIIRKETSQV